MRTVGRHVVAALIFSKDGKLFQAYRGTEREIYSNSWLLPGGGVEEGESPEEAVRRELREELGLDLSGVPLELVDDQGTGEAEKTLQSGERVRINMKFSTYKVELGKNAADIAIRLNDEFSRYEWIDPSELKKYKLAAPSVSLFERLGYL